MVSQSTPGAAPPAPPTFQNQSIGGITARTLNLGMAGLAPTYAVSKDFAVISLTAEGLEGALARMKGGMPSLATAPVYQQVAGEAQPYSFSVVDVGRIVQGVIMPFLPFMQAQNPQGAAQFNQVATLVLSRVGTMASAETIEDGLARGRIRVTMR